MNSPRESMGAAAARILSRMIDRPPAARPRRFRPLAEPLEARAVLSPAPLTRAIVNPITLGCSPAAIGAAVPSGPRPLDVVEVNGQVELQPGDAVPSGLSRLGRSG